MSDVIGSDLYIALHDLTTGPPIIRGSLTIAPGHDYWWFLEFGTGPFHEPFGYQIADHSLPELRPPAEVAAHDASGAPYEISASDTENPLVYMTSDGRRMRRGETIHPGIKPIGFVRSALFDAEVYLNRDMVRLNAQMKKGRKLLKRDQLVKMINYTLEVLLGEVRMNSPIDSDPDPYHDHRPHTPSLAQAWAIKRAK